MKWLKRLAFLVGLMILVGGGLLLVPAVRERVLWHLNTAYIQMRYALFPPEKVEFVPQEAEHVDPPPTPTLIQVTPKATITSTPGGIATTATSQPTPTPLPAQVRIQGVKYFDQHGLFNYCAPANLAMALSFWGWQGDRTDVGNWVKPFDKDKNVMPYELADFTRTQTGLQVVQRSGGTAEVLKGLLAAGYPVLVERGAYIKDLSGKISWMGHYQVVTGYDENKQIFIAQDSYYEPDYPVSFIEMEEGWRAFNYVFLVIYPAEKEEDLLTRLSSLADENEAYRAAYEKASEEVFTTAGNDLFFAWYNRGTSLVNLQDFTGAAQAYDQAFRIYADLPLDRRPWRMVWYQTGPYFAYYYSGRYQDLERLATQTIEAASEPYLEESWYWRAQARLALGDREGAIDDLRQSLVYHPDFTPSLGVLETLGVPKP
jgi:uncharacterized protein YvpB